MPEESKRDDSRDMSEVARREDLRRQALNHPAASKENGKECEMIRNLIEMSDINHLKEYLKTS